MTPLLTSGSGSRVTGSLSISPENQNIRLLGIWAEASKDVTETGTNFAAIHVYSGYVQMNVIFESLSHQLSVH
jgi:hypothetical protein